MKKILSFFILLSVGLTSYGQLIPRPQPSAAGIGYKRLLADSTLFFPAQSGIPSGMIALKSNNINRKPSILADTTNNNFYWFNPKDSIWRRLIPDTELAGYVPYMGAVASVNLGEFRLTSRSIATDSILARSSAGGRIISNSGTTVAEWGAGGGSNIDFHGFAGYNANRSASYTDRSFTDKNYVDSADALKLNISDSATYYDKVVRTFGAQTITGTKTFTDTFRATNQNIYFGTNNVDGYIFLRGFNNSTARFLAQTGVSNVYNGLLISSNPENSNTLPRWDLDLGGNDNFNFGNSDGFEIRRRRISGGVFSSMFKVDSSGVASANSFVSTSDILVNGLTIGRGGGNLSTNTVIGETSLGANTTGVSNTTIGINSLKDNKTGSGNSALGGGSLSGNTTGSFNTGTGTSALASNTSGLNNYGGGINALKNNTTGSENVAAGADAGSFLADGIALNTISNNSIFLGAYSMALADNQTNQIVIGRQAVGLGSNTTVLGNGSTTLTAIRGRTLFGTSTDDGANIVQVTGNQRITGRLGIGLNPQFGIDVSGSGVGGILNVLRTGANGAGVGTVAQFGNDARTIGDGVIAQFNMQNSSLATSTYGRITTTIISPTAGAHSGRINIQPFNAGAIANGIAIWNDGALAVNQLTNNGVDRLQVNGSTISTQYKLSALNTAPSSATDTGTTGEIRIDANFIYICTATNTWKRVAISTW